MLYWTFEWSLLLLTVDERYVKPYPAVRLPESGYGLHCSMLAFQPSISKKDDRNSWKQKDSCLLVCDWFTEFANANYIFVKWSLISVECIKGLAIVGWGGGSIGKSSEFKSPALKKGWHGCMCLWLQKLVGRKTPVLGTPWNVEFGERDPQQSKLEEDIYHIYDHLHHTHPQVEIKVNQLVLIYIR